MRPPLISDNEGTDIKCLTSFPVSERETSALAAKPQFPSSGRPFIQPVRQALDDSAAQLANRADRSAPFQSFIHDHTASAGSATQS